MNCRIIKDLLPLYVEQLTSDPSNDLIQEHIKTCQDCSRTLAGLRNDVIIASRSQRTVRQTLCHFNWSRE